MSEPEFGGTFGEGSVTDFYNNTPKYYYKGGRVNSKYGPAWDLVPVPGKVRK